MKNLLCITLAALLLLCSCGKPPMQDYCNTREGCLLGETYYENLHLQVWNPNWDATYDDICRDPLCTHDSEDSLCPSSRQLWMKTLVTDGERLYMNATNPALTDENGTVYRQIFSMKPDGSDFTLLHTYDFSTNTSLYMQYADGFLYFEQGFYSGQENFSDNHLGISEQSAYVMRIATNGGKAEKVLEDELDISSSFYADDARYYLLYPNVNGDLLMDIIDRKSGVAEVDAAGDVEGRLYDITIYGEKTYLRSVAEFSAECPSENGGMHVYTDKRWYLYVYHNGKWKKVGESVNGFTFGGGIWFTESEKRYLGSREMPTGGPNGETDPIDFYVNATLSVCCIKPADGTVTRYTLAGDVQPEDTVTIRCAAASGLWVEITNGKTEYAGETSTYHCRACIENGIMMLHRMDEQGGYS
ncbi:MAG: hypothetical protein IJF49_03285 [Clostridia bacterium]|nr:hypothetical protein [Clostridia bacterium]